MRTFPKLKNKAILAPMSGVTDVAFRTLCRKYGAGLTYTEFVSGTAVTRGNEYTAKLLKTDPSEKPIGVQLFGNKVDDIVEAARALEQKFDIIDLNCGCPAYKVVSIGAGSSLMKDTHAIAKLVNKVASAVSKPVTIKIRSGVDLAHINAVEVSKLAEDAGAAAIAVHGRTAEQGYSGKADWSIIKEVKDAVNIPVIGNGDVNTPEIFKARLDESGVDLIMIGRAAMGNPGIFKEISQFMAEGEYTKTRGIDFLRGYLELAIQHELPFPQIKSQAAYFIKGMECAARLRAKIVSAKTFEELSALISAVIPEN